jgi:SNF2 family DNA or RNA helicase
MLEVSYNAFGAPTVIGVKPHMQEEFFAALDPRMRRMPKSVVLKHLPPMLYERRDVEMTPKQKKAYHQMLDQMVAELDDENIVVTTSPLVRVTRLLQFASSYAPLEREWNERREEWEDHVILAEPSCKIDAFMNDLEDFGDDQIVVFAVSKQLINLLSKKLEKKGIAHGLITGDQNTDERQAYMDEFQAGKIKYMLCTVAAGGTGITLTKARVAVFLQRSWSMIDNIQAEARVHRIGSEQHDSVVIVDYVTAGTLEETVIGAVEQKSNRLEEILRDRALLKKVLEGEDE